MDVLARIHGPAMTPGQDFAMTAAAHRPGDSRDIEKVARGFETMFFALLCKQMRETLEPNTLFGKDAGDVWGGLFDQFMGDHMAQSGALGIAAMIRKQLNAQHNHEQHPAHPAAGRPAHPALS